MRKLVILCLILPGLLLFLPAGEKAQCRELLTFDDSREVIETTLKEYYAPVDSKKLTGAYLDGIRKQFREMGVELSLSQPTGDLNRDLSILGEEVAKLRLSPRTVSELILNGLKHMLESLKDAGTKIEEPQKRYKSLKELGYEKGGAGFFIDDDKDSLGRYIVIETLPGFPTEKYGIQGGDRITMADGIPVKDLSYTQFADIVRGPIGTEITITFERPGENRRRTVTITRRWLAPNFKSTDAEILDNDILYLRIKYLGENLDSELARVLKEYEEKGIKRIIFDLRNNGGNLKGGRDFASGFLPKGSLLYTLATRENKEIDRSSGEKLPQLPIAILLNEKSGSSSVLFSGIMQDYGRAVIVGDESEWHENIDISHILSNECVYTVTSGYYQLPKGRILLNKKGIKPDLKVAQDPFRKVSHDEDLQLQQALEAVRKMQ